MGSVSMNEEGKYLGHVKKNHLYGHMRAARAYGLMSHAVRRKVGAILVLPNGLTAQGYNGTPKGHPNACEGEDGLTLPTVIHAEDNAYRKLEEAGVDPSGAFVFCTDAACSNCASIIVEKGAKFFMYERPYKVEDGIVKMLLKGIRVFQMEDASGSEVWITEVTLNREDWSLVFGEPYTVSIR